MRVPDVPLVPTVYEEAAQYVALATALRELLGWNGPLGMPDEFIQRDDRPWVDGRRRREPLDGGDAPSLERHGLVILPLKLARDGGACGRADSTLVLSAGDYVSAEAKAIQRLATEKAPGYMLGCENHLIAQRQFRLAARVLRLLIRESFPACTAATSTCTRSGRSTGAPRCGRRASSTASRTPCGTRSPASRSRPRCRCSSSPASWARPSSRSRRPMGTCSLTRTTERGPRSMRSATAMRPRPQKGHVIVD
jgi:hypothetical protein